jgi:diguanylate cyclase (GGDEF)-like protein
MTSARHPHLARIGIRTPPWRAWARALVLGLGLACGAAALAADEVALPAYLQRQWSAWLIEAYDHPDEVMASLMATRVEPQHRSWQRFARARLAMLNGNWDQAQALYPDPPGDATAGAALQVHALLAERRGDRAQALAWADRVLAQLMPHCTAPAATVTASAATVTASASRGTATTADRCPFWLLQEASQLRINLLIHRGELANARAQAAQTLVLARAVRHVDLEALQLNQSAIVEAHDDKGAEADQFLLQGLALDGISARVRTRLVNTQAVLAQRRGQRDEQGRLLGLALDYAVRGGALRTAAVLRANLADYHLSQGRPAEARRLVQAALPTLSRFKDVDTERVARHNLALALIDERDFNAAKEQLALAAVLPRDTDARQAEALRELGVAWARVGQHQEALQAYHAERKLTQSAQTRAREAALAEVRQRLGSSAQEAKLQLLQRESQVQEQTLSNQTSLRWVGAAALVLVLLGLTLGGVLLVRNRMAHRALRRNQSLLRSLSERDPLTQLSNRRQFHKAMLRRGAEPLEGTLVLVDIDHFKRINDAHGHAVGDVVIRAYAERLQRAVRDGDLVVRWGGEEFLVYAPSLKVLHARAWIERLMPSLNGTPVTLPDGSTLDVTCSLGFLTLPLPPLGVRLSWERAVHWADLALYAAKNRGRRRAVGLVGVHVADETSLAQVEADFEGAASAARLSVVQILAKA